MYVCMYHSLLLENLNKRKEKIKKRNEPDIKELEREKKLWKKKREKEREKESKKKKSIKRAEKNEKKLKKKKTN